MITSRKILVIMVLIFFNGMYGANYKRNNRSSAMSMSLKEFGGDDFAIDVYEQNGDVIAKMNVPGIGADNIRVRIENGKLHVSGKREQKEEIKEKNYYEKQIKRGSFDRIISLPSGIDTDAMDWEVANGVLTVTIPKIEE